MDNLLIQACTKFMRLGQYDKAFDCIQNIYFTDKMNGRRLVFAFRKALTEQVRLGNDAEKNMDLIHRAYLLTAPDYFDDFMTALEWYRPPEQKFWLVRRDKLLPVCECLQKLADDELDELFISLPPRVGKTTLVMLFTVWIMCRNTEGSNLYSSYTEKVVETFHNGILEVMQDPITYDLQSIFPNFKLAATNAKDLQINLGRKKRYWSLTSRSIFGTLNGSTDVDNLLLIDDIHSGIEEARSKDQLDRKWAVVTNNLLSRKKQSGKILWIGTRWATSDCISNRLEMLQTSPDCAHIRFKVFNVPALDGNGDSNFDYMFNKGFTTKDYAVIHSSFELKDDEASWLAQYMGTPIDRQGAVFNPNDLRYFNGELPNDVEPDRKFMAVDPAWGGGDFTAAPIIYQYDNELYVVDVVYSNGDKSITQPMIVQKAIKWDVQSIVIEATRTTSSYAEGISEKLKENEAHINVQTSTKNWTGQGKAQRIFDKSVDIKDYMFFLSAGNRSKEYALFMGNVFSFTIEGKVKHDDAPDSLCMAITNAFQRSQKVKVMQRFW